MPKSTIWYEVKIESRINEYNTQYVQFLTQRIKQSRFYMKYSIK